MSRVLAHLVPREMALLGLIELALSALLIYALIGATNLPDLWPAGSPTYFWAGVDVAAATAITIAALAATIGLYRPEICLNPKRMLVIAAVSGVLASPIIMLLRGSHGSVMGEGNLLWVGEVLGLWMTALISTRLAFRSIASHHPLVRRLLVVGGAGQGACLVELLRRSQTGVFEPIMASQDDAALTPEAMRRQRIWGVVVADEGVGDYVAAALLDTKLRGIKVFGASSFQEQQLGRLDLAAIDTRSLLASEGFTAGPMTCIMKRLFDVTTSCMLLIATLPLMLIAALLIKLDSPGSVFYRQQRTGYYGVPFTLFKFRSMTDNAEAGGKPRWAQKHDPRVTRVGRFMRQTRIDELPQLLNVVRGDMSMIGPRPERPHFVAELALVIPFYREREYVKPGITGWAQVNYPYGASVEDAREKLAFDLYYVKNRSFLLDILIFCSTVRVILFREGAR